MNAFYVCMYPKAYKGFLFESCGSKSFRWILKADPEISSGFWKRTQLGQPLQKHICRSAPCRGDAICYIKHPRTNLQNLSIRSISRPKFSEIRVGPTMRFFTYTKHHENSRQIRKGMKPVPWPSDV